MFLLYVAFEYKSHSIYSLYSEIVTEEVNFLYNRYDSLSVLPNISYM